LPQSQRITAVNMREWVRSSLAETGCGALALQDSLILRQSYEGLLSTACSIERTTAGRFTARMLSSSIVIWNCRRMKP
jgi:hypothetical protein